jgi:hypothetical protein
MEPGEIYEIEVDLWSTSYIWNTGHRIRVAISSSNYPRYLNNPNTDDPIAHNTTYTVANNTLYIDSDHPSHIILPEIDQQQLNNKHNPIQYEESSESLRNKIQQKVVRFLQKSNKSFADKIVDPFVPFDSLP